MTDIEPDDMSTCNSGSTVCTPCGYNGVPDAANESLESALANFIDQFFGSLTKTVVNGSVVWTLPCDLDSGLEGNPRADGEGLACYFLRLLEEGAASVADGVLNIPNATGEPATPASGGALYVQAGALKYKGSSGTVTLLGPA